MTLIVSAGCRDLFVIQMSDRLTTTLRDIGGYKVHDSEANKTVVYEAQDAICSISYTGNAYVGLHPTEQWIASTLHGAEFIRDDRGNLMSVGVGASPHSHWTIRKALAELKRSARVRGATVEVHIIGWRKRREHWLPFVTWFSTLKGHDTTDDPSRLNAWPRKRRLVVVTGGDPPNGEVIDKMLRCELSRAGAEGMVESIAQLMRDRADQVATIGKELTMVGISHPSNGVVVIRAMPFNAANRIAMSDGEKIIDVMDAFYSPWIVTPSGYIAPSLFYGGGLVPPSNRFRIDLQGPELKRTPGIHFALMTPPRRSRPN